MKDKNGFLDKIKAIKRGPAILLQKDIGVILTNTDINKDSNVLDAGSGSGVLTANLARFVKKVYSYEKNKEFLDIAKENAEMLGLNNVVFRKKDIYSGIKEKNLDLVTLDLKEPWKAFSHVYKALRKNGYCVCFCPHITQIVKVVEVSEDIFEVVKVSETIERRWVIDELRARPQHKLLGHTVFIAVLRKV